ncbi:MAG: MarR family transcriptional regulator [Pseudomonadota bacterium]
MTDLNKTEDIIELLFFAYRDFTADADNILNDIGFGRAHHRALHFIDRQPDLSVAELLDVLGITKQSLARVLRNLVDGGYVVQNRSVEDRRRQELRLSESGIDLISRLRAPQYRRIAKALDKAGQEANGITFFLENMLDENSKLQRKRLATTEDE